MSKIPMEIIAQNQKKGNYEQFNLPTTLIVEIEKMEERREKQKKKVGVSYREAAYYLITHMHQKPSQTFLQKVWKWDRRKVIRFLVLFADFVQKFRDFWSVKNLQQASATIKNADARNYISRKERKLQKLEKDQEFYAWKDQFVTKFKGRAPGIKIGSAEYALDEKGYLYQVVVGKHPQTLKFSEAVKIWHMMFEHSQKEA